MSSDRGNRKEVAAVTGNARYETPPPRIQFCIQKLDANVDAWTSKPGER